MTAVFTHSLSQPFEVFFDEATLVLNPTAGFTGDIINDRIPAGYVLMTAGVATCSAVVYDSALNAHTINGGLANTGATLLAVGSITAPSDLSNYEAQL